MTPERWQKIEELFAQTSERSSADRVAFLDGACLGDSDLRREVERLLASHDRGPDFIERPALEVAASAIAEERARAVRGKVTGRYRIVELIGTGGMGEVYLAEDIALGRKVALKVLLPAYAEKDRDSRRRFQQEARAASALSHPNIAHIYEIGEADGADFIAMEYVEGQPLDSRIDGRPLDSLDIVDIGAQVADALDEAHAKGITHRDIKSANIIIGPRGRVKVLDFGLAKTAEVAERTTEDKAAAQIKTRPGVVLGTISYMSPEQALGRKVDTRTDIFSLGVVLYEMTTGRLPFNGESVTETIDRIAHAQPDAMARFNYDLPEELERIVKKALRKSRDERYQTARDLLVDLKNLKRELEFATQSQTPPEGPVGLENVRLAGDGTGARAPRDTLATSGEPTSSAEYIVGEIKRHKLGVTLAVLTLLALVVATPVLVKEYFSTDQSLSPSGKTMKSRRLVTSATGGKAGNTSISPDGKFVVYKDDEADRRQALWIKQVATGAARQIVAPDDVIYRGTTFSLDGNLVFYVVLGPKYPAGALFQVPVIGGTSKQLLAGISGPITQAPNGSQLSYVYEKNLMVANLDGMQKRQLAAIHGSVGVTPVGPAWSPDGKMVAFGSLLSDGGPYASVFTVEVASGEIKQATEHKWSSVRRILWLGDGRGLVLLASDPQQEFSQVWEISYPSGVVRKITNDLNGHGHISLGLTSDSSTLVTQQEDEVSHVWVMANADSSNARQLTSGEGRTDGRFGLTWLRDERLIYSSREDKGWNLWQIKLDGTQQQPLTADAYRNEYPVATPDGQNIIFRSNRETGIYHLWRMGSDGTQLKQLTTGENAEDNTARISADGRWVVYSSRTAGQRRLWKVPIEGGNPVRLTDFQSTSPDVSPDGKLIACAFLDETVNPARWRVAIIPFAGGPPVKTIDLPRTADLIRSTIDGRAVTYVRWLSTGRTLAYVDQQNGVSNIWSQSIDGGPPRQLTNFPSGLIFNFELSPDGKQIACARGTRSSDVILITDFR